MVVLSFSVPYGKMMIPSSLYVSIWCQSNGVIHIKGCVSIGWNDSSWLYGIIQHCGWYKTKHVILLYIVCMHIYIYTYNYTYIRHYIIICFCECAPWHRPVQFSGSHFSGFHPLAASMWIWCPSGWATKNLDEGCDVIHMILYESMNINRRRDY